MYGTPPLLARLISTDLAARLHVGIDDETGFVVHTDTGESVESIDRLAELMGDRLAWRPPTVRTSPPLTDREILVSQRLTEGRTTREIAQELGVSDRTVTSVRAVIRRRSASQDVTIGSAGVAVVGAVGLSRSLVHRCLEHHRSDVTTEGVVHLDDRVRVIVAPTNRDLAVADSARLVIVGALPPSTTLLDAVRGGAVAVLAYTATVRELLAAVDAAHRGEAWLTRSAVRELVDLVHVDRGRGIAPLTSRDTDVVVGIRMGESVKQTARRLGVSPRTIENRRQQLYARFGVRTARQLDRAVGDLRARES